MNAGGRALLMLLSAAFVLASCATVPQQTAQTTVPQAAEPQPPAEHFVATEELYKKTFDEVQAVIADLTRIIADGDYSQWLSYLTADYVGKTGSPTFLHEASQAPVLKKNGIVLMSLQDYFDNVVVRSRQEAKLDDINFVDKTHVKAIARVRGEPVILQYLVQEEGRWKVGVLPGETK